MVDFIARYAETKDEIDGPIFQEAKGWLVVVGDGDVVPALEMGIRFLLSGQTGRIWSHSKYSLGPGIRTHKPTTSGTTKEPVESYTLPPNSSVIYEVTVQQKVMDTSRLNPYFTIQKALTRKNIANDVFQNEWKVQPDTAIQKEQKSTSSQDDVNENKDVASNNAAIEADVSMAMSRAIRLYQKAASDMETLLQGTYFQQVEEDHPQRHQARQVMLDCLNNIIAVHLRSEEYHKAKLAAVKVLEHDTKNLKALLRAAKAAMMDPASTMEEAEVALAAAEKEIVYKDVKEEKELKRLRQQFKKKQQEYKMKSKAMFGDKLKSTKPDDSADKGSVDDKTNTEDVKDGTKQLADGKESSERRNRIPPSKMSSVLDDDDTSFWKSQVVSMVMQLSLIVTLSLFVRWLIQHKTFMYVIWEDSSKLDSKEPAGDEF